jgi:class 3 adenylate cyclase
MISKSLAIFRAFKARLSQKIVLGVFLSLFVIEVIIFIPSYTRREYELLMQLEERSGAIVNSIVRLTQEDMMANKKFREKAKTVAEDSLILGIAIYNSEGQLIETFGRELPEASFNDIEAQNIYRNFDRQINRYDIGWPADYLGINYALIARMDAQSVTAEMYAFKGRIALLVLIISVFVTFFTMLILNALVIAPILRLRDDLMAAGETITQEKNYVKFYSISANRNDELGQVMVAFNQMYERIFQEIVRRKMAEEILRDEQEKSERLLLNILPPAIATKLKKGEKNIADGFAEVTILFADMVGFTQLSEKISPPELVSLLNNIFSRFDRLTDKHDLEKIKTIGDAYMVVGGLPIPRDNNAEAIADMALDMLAEISLFNAEKNLNLSIRIGINTGPVVAGVIGTKKFIYDLWGDAVNTASRMESHGIPDAIQVSETSYNLLKEKYLFEKRGKISIKGKGEMNTYLLLSRKDD